MPDSLLPMDTSPRPLRNLFAIAALLSVAAAPAPDEAARQKAEAARVTITRDTWGIAHVVGQTDADSVFGAIYAQAEDDFARIEANYLTSLGRTAEADGEKAIWADLRQRLYVDPADLQAKYFSRRSRIASPLRGSSASASIALLHNLSKRPSGWTIGALSASSAIAA